MHLIILNVCQSSFNITRTSECLISLGRTHGLCLCRATLTNCTLNHKVVDKPIKQVNEVKLLGIIIDKSLTWDKHIYEICNIRLVLLKRLKTFIHSNTLLMLFNSVVLPHFDNANVVWRTTYGTQIKYVYKIQKRAARILTDANRFSRAKPLFEKLNWMHLTERIQYHTAVFDNLEMS